MSLPVTLPVVCGGTTGQLIVATGKIRRNEQEYTPTEFERLGGKAAAKKWKQSIRLLEYEEDGQISLNTPGLGDWLVQHGLEIRANLLNVVTGPAALASPSPAPMAFPPVPPHHQLSEHPVSHTLQHLQLLQRQQQPFLQQQPPAPGYSPQLSPRTHSTEDAGQSAAAVGSGEPQAYSARPSASRPQEEALSIMQAYLEGKPLPSTPLALELGKELALLRVCGHTVDLRLLYVMVRDAGGYQAVQRNKAWGALAAQCVQQSVAQAPEEPCSLSRASRGSGDGDAAQSGNNSLPPIRTKGDAAAREVANTMDLDHSNTSPPREALPSPFLQLRAAPSTHALLGSGVRNAYERFLLRVERKEQLLLQCGLGGFPVAPAAARAVPTAVQRTHRGGARLSRSQPTLAASAANLLPSYPLNQRRAASAAEGMHVELPPQQGQQHAGSSRMRYAAGAAVESMSIERASSARGPIPHAPLLPSSLSSPLPERSPQQQPLPHLHQAVPAAAASSQHAQASLHSVHRRTLSATKVTGGSSSLRRKSQVRSRHSFSPASMDLAAWDSAAAAAAVGAVAGAQEGAGGSGRGRGPLLSGQRSLLREYQEGASNVVDTSSDGYGSLGSWDAALGSPAAASSQGRMGRTGSCPLSQQLLLQQAAALSLGSSGGSGELGASMGGGGGQRGSGGGGGEGALGGPPSSRFRRGSTLRRRTGSGDGSVGDGSVGGGGDQDSGGGSGGGGGGGACSRGEMRAPKRSFEELQSSFAAGGVGGCRAEWADADAVGWEGKGEMGDGVEAANPCSPRSYQAARFAQQQQQYPKRMLSLNAEASQKVGALLHQLGSGSSAAGPPPPAHNTAPLPSTTAAHPHSAWQQQLRPSFSSAPLHAFTQQHPALSCPLAAQQDASFLASHAQQLHMQAAQPPPMLGTHSGLLTSKGGGYTVGGGGGDAAAVGGGLWEVPGPGSGPDLHTLLASDMCAGQQDTEDFFEGLVELISEGKGGGNMGVGGVSGGLMASSSLSAQQLQATAMLNMGQQGQHGALVHQQLLENPAYMAAAPAAAATAAANAAHAAHSPFMPPQQQQQQQPPVPLQPCNSGSSSNTTGDNATVSAAAAEGGGSCACMSHAHHPAAHHAPAHAFHTMPPPPFHNVPHQPFTNPSMSQRASSTLVQHRHPLAVGEPAGEVQQPWQMMAVHSSGQHYAKQQGSKTNSRRSSMGGAAPASANLAARTLQPCSTPVTAPMLDTPCTQAQPSAHGTDLPAEMYHALLHDFHG